MTKLIVYISFLLAVLALFVLVNLLIRKAAYSRESRYCQIREIAAFLIFTAVMTNRYAFSGHLFAANMLINAKPLAPFWRFVMPEREYELIYLLLSLLITNLLFMLLAEAVFGFVKNVFQKTDVITFSKLEGAEKLIHLPWAVNDVFYAVDDESGRYQVTNRGFTISIWAKWMKYAFLIIGLLEIVFLSIGIFRSTPFIIDNGMDLAKGWYLLPAAGFLFMEQIQLYLEGVLEFQSDRLSSMDIEGRLYGDLDALRMRYHKDYNNTPALITDYSKYHSKGSYESLASNELTSDQKNRCEHPELLQMMINQVKKTEPGTTSEYQNAVIELLNGGSIFVRDFLTGEILTYLVSYMNWYLSQKKNFIILCQDGSQKQRIQESVVTKLEDINQIHNVWTVGGTEDLLSDHQVNILVCSWNELIHQELLTLKPTFFQSLKGVIIADGMRFFALNNPHKVFLFSLLRNYNEKLQYIVVGDNDDASLRTAFEYYVRQELIPFKKNVMPKETHVLIWAEESKHKIQRHIGIGGISSPYLGVAIPLALTALKYGLPYVNIYGDGSQSSYSEKENLKNAASEITRYLGKQQNIEDRIRINPMINSGHGALEVLVIFDRERNLLPKLSSWTKYGGEEGTLIHVVSPPYALREYFADKLPRDEVFSGEFDPIISYESGLKNSVLLEVLLKLANVGMTESQIRDLYKKRNCSYSSIKDTLEESLAEVLRLKERYNIYEHFRFETYQLFDKETNEFRSETRISLIDAEIRKRIKTLVGSATLRSKDDVIDYISIPVGDVSNHFLPGQIVAIHGRQYLINRITDDSVIAEQFDVEERKQYYPCGEFIIDLDESTRIECEDMDIIDYNMYHATATRMIHGYWESNCGIDFAQPDSMKFRQHELEVKCKDILLMEIRIPRSCFGERSQEAASLMGFLLQEMFATLFPYNYMDLFAVVEMDLPEDFWESAKKHGFENDNQRKLHTLVPFCRPGEHADNDYIKIYVVEFTQLEKGMIRGLYKEKSRVFKIMRSYLSWYLEEGKGTYLNLGFDDIPSCFAAEELKEYLNKMLPNYSNITEKEEESSNEHLLTERCSYCGSEVVFYEKLDDGRIMCADCAAQKVEQEEELRDIYLITAEEIKKYYRIRLPKGIEIKMKSADSIRKKTGAFGTRVLGFYNRQSQEVWIEGRGPRNSVRSTVIHELVHVWQQEEMDKKKLQKLGDFERKCLLEGQASYVEVDAMKQFGEAGYAEYMVDAFRLDKSEYGIGFRVFEIAMREFSDRGSHWTPFVTGMELLKDPNSLREFIRQATL